MSYADWIAVIVYGGGGGIFAVWAAAILWRRIRDGEE